MTATTASKPRTARLETRIAPEVLNAVKRAAEITGTSVSDFVVAAARDAAQRAIEDAQIIRLSIADQQLVADLLAHPAPPNAALKKAFAAHRKLIKSSQ